MVGTATLKLLKCAVLLLFSVMLLACGSDNIISIHPKSSPTDANTYPVDATFIEFYNHFTSIKSLGPAISPPFNDGNLIKQYVEAGLMVYDPSAPESNRYYLQGIGRKLDVEELAVPDSGLPNSRYVNGHNIYGDFLSLYNLLGGAQLVGLPLTEERHNLSKGRVEQYFENLGLYQLDNDPTGMVHLLAYGYIDCDFRCRYQPAELSVPGPQVVIDDPFGRVISRLGLPFTGLVISPPRRGPDGRMEVILENLVLVTDSQEPTVITARPIVELAGVYKQPLVSRLDDPLMVFIPVDGGKGHNVPVFFYNYLRLHGDLALSGLPITEVYLTDKGVFQQCFTNLCLIYDPHAPATSRLYLAPMGKLYKRCLDSPELAHCKPAGEGLRLQAWEGQNIVSSKQPQVVYIAVFDNGIPLINREPVLTVTFPDGSKRIFNLPPTNKDGQTSIVIAPIDAPSGTLIPYKACLARMKGSPVCVGDNYLIWNYPN